ncbi:MAG TPA: hypothetical protein DEF30_02880 [Proteiniclasticum sp.]|uniref:hypothetical protein n=1 Tax=Proteiniclasticum sp. TaxID=2053595 RepID=UPI000E976D74|nr:hypothetical protein [Proteiniclasticum sp.]HBW12757.1 hypothetical protein [Proteiniclasticum sp.]
MTGIKKGPWFDEIMTPENYKHYYEYSSLKKSTVTSLIKLLEAQYALPDLDQDELERAMKEAVRSYKNHKGTAIFVYKKFLQYLLEVHQCSIEVSFPEVDVWNTFERQMYLAKELQGGDLDIEDLSERLWVSTRTLEEDLKKLRGLDEDPIQILGRKFEIRDMERKNGKVLFSSTVHPFFLTWNLTQVIAALKGLQMMMENPLMKAYAEKSAEDLWMQLSSFGKNRILQVSKELIQEDTAFYEALARSESDAFLEEKRFKTTDGPSVLMDCMKNEKSFFMVYLEEDGSAVFLEECRCIPGTYKGSFLKIEYKEGVRTVFFDRVLRSAYTKEELY